MTSAKANSDGGRDAADSNNPANRGRRPPNNEKSKVRTGELSIEQLKKWLATRRAESRAKRDSDKDGGAPA